MRASAGLECSRSGMTRIEECGECGEAFAVLGGHTGPMIDLEDINCPHCGALWGTERIADVFKTRKLTPAEESEYARSKKRQSEKEVTRWRWTGPARNGVQSAGHRRERHSGVGRICHLQRAAIDLLR